MNSFTYCVPTKVIFGAGTTDQVGQAVKAEGAARVLVLYGGGSAVKSGLIGRVEASLKAAGLPFDTVGGVHANPLVEFSQETVDAFRGKGVDFLLAVGGGSVIDTAKAIGIGLAEEAPIWDYFTGKARVTAELPVGVVLTIAAAGSETSDSSVQTRGADRVKLGLSTPLNRPRFAIMDPELTYTLPARQTACGVADIMMHTMERYFTVPTDDALTDAFAEALLRTTREYGDLVMRDPMSYKARSEIMWCGSLSHNDLTGLGHPKNFCAHAMGHELSAKFDLPHGESLTIMWPAWAKYVYRSLPDRFARFARSVFGVTERDDGKAALMGIEAAQAYFKNDLHMPVTFGEAQMGVQSDEVLRDLAVRCTFGHTRKVGVFQPLGEEELYQIYKSVNH